MLDRKSFILNEEGLHLLHENLTTRISNYINIKKIIIEKDTDIETYELEYIRRNTNELNSRIIRSEDIQKNNILSLSKYGIDINEQNKTLISEYLFANLEIAPVKLSLDGYGWKKYNTKEIFITNNILSDTPLEENIIKNSDKLDLAPHGHIEEWLNMYNEYVLGNKYLELAVVFGLSAPIINYLSEMYPDLTNILIHISGDSTAGKSTASMLAVSTAGNPNQLSDRSLMRKWSGTENSITALLENISGIPIVFDELSSFKGENLTSLAYTLTDV